MLRPASHQKNMPMIGQLRSCHVHVNMPFGVHSLCAGLRIAYVSRQAARQVQCCNGPLPRFRSFYPPLYIRIRQVERRQSRSDGISRSRIVRDAILSQRCSYLTDQHRAHRPKDHGAQEELSEGKYPAEGRYAGLWSHGSSGSLAFFLPSTIRKLSPVSRIIRQAASARP